MSTDLHWEQWGTRDPYFGVLTDPKFRSEAITPEAREEFFQSGHAHVDHVLSVCRAHIDPQFMPRRVLDFGCGVGRLVIPFARIAPDVVGVDISPAMLAEARVNCEARSIAGATLVLSDDSLSRVEGDFDLVHSCIVLQHIEIERGRKLFARLVERIRPGGIGALQVTFAWAAFPETFGQPPAAPPSAPPSRLAMLKTALKNMFGVESLAPPAPEPSPDPEMQMNFYNLSDLMFFVQQAGVPRVHVEFSDHGGALGVFLFFRKPG